jgi:ABC-type branched-subunit amino acid transport system substrate-binding protein
MRHLLLFCAFVSSSFGLTDVLKIGVVAPLSGDLYKYGEALRNTLTLAHEDTPDFKVQLFFEDNECKPAMTNLATRRLISLNHVDVIFDPYTSEANIVAPIADKAGVLQFSNCWNSNVIEKSKYSFSSSVSFKNFGDAILAILKEKGVHRAAFVHNPDWVEGTDYLNAKCKEAHIEVYNESFQNEDRDFRTAIMRLREKNPDFYVCYLENPTLDIFMKQLRVLAPGAQVTGYLDMIEDKHLIEGATYASEYPSIPEFYARYEKRFHVSAEQTLAPNAYDNFKMLAKVCSEMKTWDVKVASDKIRHMKDYPGVTGKLTCLPTGVFLSQTHVVKIVNGKKEFLK